MKKLFASIFDLIFPRRLNDAAIFDISPADFYKNIPRWHSEIYPNMQAIFHYQNPTAKAMIKELKSSRNIHAAQIAAYALANHLQENDIQNVIIVPMPISKKRRKKRGYNQCELIAEFFSQEIFARKETDQDADRAKNRTAQFEIRIDMLEKPIDTEKLALQNRAARLKANKGVFKARCTLSNTEQRIIIIDDVITTGSTMSSAIRALQAAGAENISGVGIAH